MAAVTAAAVRRLPGIQVAYMDQCVVGQSVGKRPAKKPTGWMTNSECIYQALSIKCDGAHEHASLLGGKAAATAAYPAEVDYIVLKAVRQEPRLAGRLDSVERADLQSRSQL